ncbi:MAG: tRNA lysidine(34) synthetase TilS [Clostridiales bacterium]|nr:tRNA lysidine(34) synthetase TilS [Clostridiales bacterium]
MHSVLEKTSKALCGYEGKRLAVGLSGGRDSVCLLHAAISCGVVDKANITAIHVHHGLRETADRDMEFCKTLCDRLGVKIVCVAADVKKIARDNGLGIEQAARNVRYGIFYDMIKSGEVDCILTAHHALDNAESVLMHLFRGAGLDGLRGMDSNAIVRPFLDVYPDELDDYVKENGLDYVVDETNLDDDADRNFIRLNVLPLIEKRYAGAVRAINGFSKECGAAVDVLDNLLDEAHITRQGGATIIPDAALSSPLAARYVRYALVDFTLTDVTRAQIESVVALKDGRTGAVAELAHGVKAAREDNSVAIYIPRDKYDGEVELVIGTNYIDGLSVDVKRTKKSPKSIKGGVVDGDKLCGATLRFRRDGDLFKPFGGGTKKLKQYLIDKKIPSRLRDRLPLVCRGNEVLLIVGVEISDGVRVDENTVNTLAVSLRARP